MQIFIEIDKKNKDRIVFRNQSDNVEMYKHFLKENKFDFSFFAKLKGDKGLLERAFREELYESRLN